MGAIRGNRNPRSLPGCPSRADYSFAEYAQGMHVFDDAAFKRQFVARCSPLPW